MLPSGPRRGVAELGTGSSSILGLVVCLLSPTLCDPDHSGLGEVLTHGRWPYVLQEAVSCRPDRVPQPALQGSSHGARSCWRSVTGSLIPRGHGWVSTGLGLPGPRSSGSDNKRSSTPRKPVPTLSLRPVASLSLRPFSVPPGLKETQFGGWWKVQAPSLLPHGLASGQNRLGVCGDAHLMTDWEVSRKEAAEW